MLKGWTMSMQCLLSPVWRGYTPSRTATEKKRQGLLSLGFFCESYVKTITNGQCVTAKYPKPELSFTLRLHAISYCYRKEKARPFIFTTAQYLDFTVWKPELIVDVANWCCDNVFTNITFFAIPKVFRIIQK